MEVTVTTLRESLRYDPLTGDLFWKERPRRHFKSGGSAKAWHTNHCGKVAGSRNGQGYRHVNLAKSFILSHRAAWAIYYGEWPDGLIDHINGKRDDNRLCNLRVVDAKGNSQSSAIHRRNTSGRTGVSQRDGGKWVAYIHRDKIIHLGTFDTFEDACGAREKAESLYGYLRREVI